MECLQNEGMCVLVSIAILLIFIKQDPLMSECLIYQIKPGKTVVRAMEMTVHTHTLKMIQGWTNGQ